MRIFLTGATGWVGTAVARDLIEAGHQVTGMVRSAQKAGRLAGTGVTPVIGTLGDLDILREAAAAADGTIHTAFGLDFSRMAALSVEDSQAIDIFGETYAGSDRPIVVTGGFDLSLDGDIFTESERPAIDPDFPRASEQAAFALAQSGVRASVIRLARSVHGVGEGHGFVPMLANIAREKGVSAYVGDGENLWPTVHRLDAARLFRLALERGARGQAFHAVAENVPVRRVAEAIGRQLNLPTRSLSAKQAEDHFGALARWVAGSAPASSEQTRAELGWEPEQLGLIADIDRPEYYV